MQMPLHHFLGYILGEIARSGPLTSLEIFDRLNGKDTGPDDAMGFHAVSLPLIKWAGMQLDRRGCVFLGSGGWKFIGWPPSGSFGHIDPPVDLLNELEHKAEELLVQLPVSTLQNVARAELKEPEKVNKPIPAPIQREPTKPPTGKPRQAALFS